MTKYRKPFPAFISDVDDALRDLLDREHCYRSRTAFIPYFARDEGHNCPTILRVGLVLAEFGNDKRHELYWPYEDNETKPAVGILATNLNMLDSSCRPADRVGTVLTSGRVRTRRCHGLTDMARESLSHAFTFDDED